MEEANSIKFAGRSRERFYRQVPVPAGPPSGLECGPAVGNLESRAAIFAMGRVAVVPLAGTLAAMLRGGDMIFGACQFR